MIWILPHTSRKLLHAVYARTVPGKCEMMGIRCIIVLTILTFTIYQRASAVEYTNFWNGAASKAHQEKVVFLQKSLSECITLCALRPWCQVAGFHQKAMVCELYFEDVSVCEEAGEHCQLQSMIFIKRADITDDVRIFYSQCIEV